MEEPRRLVYVDIRLYNVPSQSSPQSCSLRTPSGLRSSTAGLDRRSSHSSTFAIMLPRIEWLSATKVPQEGKDRRYDVCPSRGSDVSPGVFFFLFYARKADHSFSTCQIDSTFQFKKVKIAHSSLWPLDCLSSFLICRQNHNHSFYSSQSTLTCIEYIKAQPRAQRICSRCSHKPVSSAPSPSHLAGPPHLRASSPRLLSLSDVKNTRHRHLRVRASV